MAFAVLACLFLTCGIKASAQTAYVVLSDNQTKLTFYYNSNKPESTEETPVFEVNDGTSPNWNITIHEGNNIIRHPYPDINTVVFNKSFANFKPTTCKDWFWGMTKLTTIQGIEYLNTEDVTDTYRMFEDCSSLTSIDLSHFNTAKVTNMGEMFMGCSSLTSIDVKTFNTENVENMNNMFDGCSSLISLDLSSFNTAKLELLTKMFKGCTNLRAIFASKSFDLKKLTVLLPQEYEAGWNYDVFKDCESLVGAIAYDSEKTDITYANYSTGYFLPTNTPYAILDYRNHILTFKAALEGEEVPTTVGESYVYNIPTTITDRKDVPWLKLGYDYSKDITDVVFDESFKYARPMSCAYWFVSRTSLNKIQGIEYLNTSLATSMKEMFAGCQALSSLDLSSFNTSKVTDMSSMFDNCWSLEDLNLSNFNTANVTDMSYMFVTCPKLTTLDLRSFTTDNVTNMDRMFGNCRTLKSVFISTFKVTKDGDNPQSIFDNNSSTCVYTTPALYSTNGAYDFGYSNTSVYPSIKRLQIYSPINTKAEYGTICIPQGCDLNENDYSGFDKLYEVSKISSNGTNDVVSLTRVTKMKPGMPYIFHRSNETTSNVEGAITFHPNYDKEAESAYNEGIFRGTFSELRVAYYNSYILQSDGKFHKWEEPRKVGVNRAYLYLSGSANANMLTLSFNDIETGIKGVTENTTEDNAPVYDLMGRRVNSMVKGNVYLKGGKKFVF